MFKREKEIAVRIRHTPVFFTVGLEARWNGNTAKN